MGFLGRYNGLFIKNELDSIYLNNDFVEIKEETRNCIAILAAGGSQKDILEVGLRSDQRRSDGRIHKYDKYTGLMGV